MKLTIALALGYALTGITAFSHQIRCFNAQDGREVVWLADDRGTITASSVKLGPSCQIARRSEETYFHSYGEFLRTIIACANQNYYLMAGKAFPNSSLYTGKIYSGPTPASPSIDIFCK